MIAMYLLGMKLSYATSIGFPLIFDPRGLRHAQGVPRKMRHKSPIEAGKFKCQAFLAFLNKK